MYYSKNSERIIESVKKRRALQQNKNRYPTLKQQVEKKNKKNQRNALFMKKKAADEKIREMSRVRSQKTFSRLKCQTQCERNSG